MITEYHRLQCAALHALLPEHGASGAKWGEDVRLLTKKFGESHVLDYGAGKGGLAKYLSDRGLVVNEYDPAIPGKDEQPSFAPIVSCTDVLEHVEPQFLDSVLADIERLTGCICFFVISLQQAKKRWLPNGKNAHLIIERILANSKRTPWTGTGS